MFFSLSYFLSSILFLRISDCLSALLPFHCSTSKKQPPPNQYPTHTTPTPIPTMHCLCRTHRRRLFVRSRFVCVWMCMRRALVCGVLGTMCVQMCHSKSTITNINTTDAVRTSRTRQPKVHNQRHHPVGWLWNVCVRCQTLIFLACSVLMFSVDLFYMCSRYFVYEHIQPMKNYTIYGTHQTNASVLVWAQTPRILVHAQNTPHAMRWFSPFGIWAVSG